LALISLSGALVPTFAPIAAAPTAPPDAERVVGLVRAAVPIAVAADPDRARDLVADMRWQGELAQPVLRNTGAELGKIENAIEVKALAPRSARLIEVHASVEER
jgi:hypothetical protein